MGERERNGLGGGGGCKPDKGKDGLNGFVGVQPSGLNGLGGFVGVLMGGQPVRGPW